MGFRPFSLGLFRVLAAGAAKLLLRLSGLLAGLAFVVGALRFLPWLFGSGLPAELWIAFGAELLAMSLEVALFVAPVISFALASSALVERGELRALGALGVRPARIAWSGWPVLLCSALVLSLASGLWGSVAISPARRVETWLNEAREGCARKANEAPSAVPVIVAVPTIDFVWICAKGEVPRLVGTFFVQHRTAALSAASVSFSEDMSTLRFSDARLFVRETNAPDPPVQVHATELSISGFAPALRPSNLHPVVRALLVSGSAGLLSLWVSALVLARSIKSRVHALCAGVSGASAALLFLSSLERSPSAFFLYLGVPALGCLALWLTVHLPFYGARLRARPRGREAAKAIRFH